MPTNPLLGPLDPPPYEAIRLEHLQPAIEQIIADNTAALLALIASQAERPTWDDLVMAVDALDVRLDNAMNLIITLHARSPDWNAAVDACWLLTKAYHQQKLLNTALSDCYARLAASAHGQNFSHPRKVALQQALKTFRLSGAGLPDAERARLLEIQATLGTLQGRFFDNLAAATDAWGVLISDAQRLRGVAALERAAMARKAQAQGLEGWWVTLEEAPSMAILEQAEDRALREQVYTAFHSRASDQDAGPDNGLLLAELTALRHERARLLGFASAAELSLQTKTAGSVTTVTQFLADLAEQARPLLAREHRRLQEYFDQHGVGPMQPWDIAYCAQQTRRHPLSLSAEEFRAYFPFDQVLQALVDLAATLFDVHLVPSTTLQTWHPDVRVYEAVQDHALIGYLYIDALAREGKDEYVWTLRLWNRHVDAEGRYHKGAAVLISAVAPGAEGAQPLLTHLDLRKLYHEFGHCLHQLLVTTTDYRLADLNVLGPDGLEFVSELLERWCWSATYLAGIAVHHQTRQPLAPSLLQGFLEQARQQESLPFTRDLIRSLLDMQLHLDPDDPRSLQQMVRDTHTRVSPWPLADFERPASAFDHLVSGYDAGYYSYLWSRVYAIDAFTRFEAEGVLNPVTGRALLETIIAPGTLRSMAENFEAFRGRPLSPLPFLTWNGLIATGTE